MSMHPADMVFFWARANPERLALIQPGLVVTYRTLSEAIESVAARIDELGLDKAEPVAVAVHHPFYQLVICFALLRRGYVCGPISRSVLPFLQPNGINNLIYAVEGFVAPGGRNIRFDPTWLRRKASGPLEAGVTESGPAADATMIFFTSGTTGVPKKVTLPSGIFSERGRWMPIVGECNYSRMLVVPGLNASFGFLRTAMILYAGKTACFASNLDEQLHMIDMFKVEAIVASPQQALALVETIEKRTRHHPNSLKEVRIAGGFCSRELVARLKASLSCRVTIKYGATEAGVIAVADHDMIAHAPYAVGFPVPGAQVQIVDDNDQAVPRGRDGIVRCRSGYYSRVFAAANKDRAHFAAEAWWYPGDLGRLTEEGILCVIGRTDDLINSGGVKIAAGPLDEMMRKIPGVLDAGVCAMRGRAGVEEVWVAVVPQPDIDASAVVTSIKENRDFRVVIGEVKVVDAIPRNELGKLQRNALRELLVSMKS